MSDEPVTHTSLSLFGRQVFEYGSEKDENGVNHTVTLPGFYEIYTQVDGVDVVLERRKAPGLLADIERAKKNQGTGTAAPPVSGEQPAQPAPSPPSAPAPPTQ